MSDEISILSLISEENPTSVSAFCVIATPVAIDYRMPHFMPAPVTATFTCLHNAMQTVSAMADLWHYPPAIGNTYRAAINLPSSSDFANAKTPFTPDWKPDAFSLVTTLQPLPNWHCHLTVVNGTNDFTTKFGNSNSTKVQYPHPQFGSRPNGRDGQRVSS
ncbi:MULTISPECIES: hypothetical protein [Dickeya]|uniref:hypothetical protein n=1 Tax=Dickeya TaxID=204037 RepID=UPI001AED0C21|nr:MULTISPECIES: hypothetical protein [Dickeya]MBP2836162.1 hypothetical protein [Dickeya parazeae]UCZ74970.1 hypothetical protein LHK94_18520 [Dickeya zeae]